MSCCRVHGCVSRYNTLDVLSKVSERITVELFKITVFDNLSQPHSRLTTTHRGTPANIRTYLILLETRIMSYIWPLIVWVCLHSNFSGGLRKTNLSTRVRFGLSRYTNRKCVCDFLLVGHSNLDPIL